jgi:DNA-binding ferritin-like protein
VISLLADRISTVILHVHQGIETTTQLSDPVSADLLTGLSAILEKQLWFLEAHKTQENA